MTEKEEKREKPEKHEPKIREYEVEFILKDKSSKQKFNTAQEIYLLYVHCSKVFQCGLFSLYFNGINLNFIEKNSKLSTIFKKDTKNPKIIVMVHQIFIVLFYLLIGFIVNKNAFYMAF